MIIRGALSHRDGHGKCGLLSPVLHHCLTPFFPSSFGLFRQERKHRPTHISRSINQSGPCVLQHTRTDVSEPVSQWAPGAHGL